MAEFIVAIELGSSKITGIAGKKNPDGSISVLAVVKENAAECIKKGVVYNIDKTGQCLTNIIKKLQNQLKCEILHVYVGVGGKSIRSVRNVHVKNLPAETIITSEMINELMDANRNMVYPGKEILDAATQEYKVDNQYVIDPVGIKATKLEGNFLNILERKSFYDNLNICFAKAGINIAEMYLAPLALADSLLSEQDKLGGCVLVDLGADTTTVSVYYKNILRHLAVIPLGGNSITKDIASLQMSFDDAEKMKIKYASAYTETNEINPTIKYPIDAERDVESSKFINIVEARVMEIIENVWNQIPSEYSDRLLGGIVLTGGGSNMKNIERAFRIVTRTDKVRIAKFVTQTIKSSNADINAHNGMMNTILSLLAKGDMNCAGNPIDPTRDIFHQNGAQQTSATGAALHNPARNPNDLNGTGVVMTPAEKEKAELEKKKKEAEEKIKRDKEEEHRKRLEEENKKNKTINKIGKSIRSFLDKMMNPEE